MIGTVQTTVVIALVAAAAGLWFALPQRLHRWRMLASFAATGALLWLVSLFERPGDEIVSRTLFWLFSFGAILCGVLMITSRDPVHGALWFAVATLAVCGLFMLLSAPFLAAATVIVYAGAIIVTFMFVIMLAQQSGVNAYDQRSKNPVAALFVSSLLLGALVMTLINWRGVGKPDGERPAITVSSAPGVHALSVPTAAAPQGSLYALGRSLFGDYLFAVEIAGTVLLVATVGAIVMAPRRAQGNL